MGGLTILSFLANNPNLNIAGVILSAPFLGLNDSAKVDDKKKMLIKILATELDVISICIIFNLLNRNSLSIQGFLFI